LTHITDRIESYLGLEIESESYGLSREGMQLFGVIRCKTDREDHGLAIGCRSSHDKSISVGFATGASLFVCDNLAFSGSGTTYVRKHTTNVWRDVVTKIDRVLGRSAEHYESVSLDMDNMKQIPMQLDAGYELIGRALGHGILRSQQANVVLRDWKTPRHEDFSERNLFSLYQCFTEGLKKGPAGETMDRYANAHEWFRPMLPSKPTVFA